MGVNEGCRQAGAFPGGGAAHLFRATGSVAPVSAAPPGEMAARLTAKHQNKRPGLSTEPFVYVAMAAPFPGYGPVAPVSAAPPGRWRRVWPQNTKTKGPVFRLSLSFYLMPGSSLLSHGETPHYHRRYGVSLLSSAWGQVGPPRYRRQGKFCFTSPSYDALVNLYHAENHLKSPKQLRRCKVKPHGSLVSVSSTYRYAYTPDLSTSSSLTFLQET